MPEPMIFELAALPSLPPGVRWQLHYCSDDPAHPFTLMCFLAPGAVDLESLLTTGASLPPLPPAAPALPGLRHLHLVEG
jgi:hypothetical protein